MAEDAYETYAIRVLDSRDAVRLRPGMYIGSTNSAGIEHIVYELVSNVLDQYLVGRAKRVEVLLEDDGHLEIRDDGPGLPFDLQGQDEGVSLATQYLTSFHRTATADDHTPHVHLSLHGVGLCPLNALSETFTVRSWREGRLWSQDFREGQEVGAPRVLRTGTGRGTVIRLLPDRTIFGGERPRVEVIRRTLKDSASLHAGIRIVLQGEEFYIPGGLLTRCKEQYAEQYGVESGELNSRIFYRKTRVEQVEVEIAAMGEAGHSEQVYSWANGVETIEGGSHVEGLREGFAAVGYLPMLSMVHVLMYEVQFAGPTKNRLAVDAARRAVYQAITEDPFFVREGLLRSGA